MQDEISQEGIARTENDAGIDMQANHEQVIKEKENPLASKLRQIREAVSTRTSQINLLLDIVRQNPKIDPEEVPITWEEMNSRVDEVQAGELPNIEHVLKCQEIIRSCLVV